MRTTRFPQVAAKQSLGSRMICALHDKGCTGPIQWHHILPRQRLKQEFRYGASWGKPHRPVGRNDILDRITQPQILADERNRVWLCARHHELVEKKRVYLREIPESVHEFARDYGLEGWLERYVGEA